MLIRRGIREGTKEGLEMSRVTMKEAKVLGFETSFRLKGEMDEAEKVAVATK